MKFLLKTFFVLERLLITGAILMVFTPNPQGDYQLVVSTVLAIALAILFLVNGISTILDCIISYKGSAWIVGLAEIVMAFMLLANLYKVGENDLFAILASVVAVVLVFIFVIRQTKEINVVCAWQLSNGMHTTMKLSLFLFPVFIFARLLYYVYVLLSGKSIGILNVITIIMLFIAMGLWIIESYIHFTYRDWDTYGSRRHRR